MSSTSCSLMRLLLGLAAAAAGLTPLPAAAQGTWLQTQCLVGAQAAAAGGCKASPAWGQTGVEHVQALAAAAGPGNLGLSLVKPETLPAANAARAQLAAVMLAYLDANRPGPNYRWFGPVAAPAAAAASTGAAAVAPETAPTAATTKKAAANAASPAAATPSSVAAPAALQTAWLGGALGDLPQARSASWWLASPYRGATAPAEGDAAPDPYRVLRFLAATCPQLEGKVAPNAWTRCTTYNVAEPASWALVAVALLLAAAARQFSAWCLPRAPLAPLTPPALPALPATPKLRAPRRCGRAPR